MNIYKRGQVYWVKFIIDGKLYQHSCKTKDKETAQEIAAAIYADTIRDRFNLPVKYAPEYLFTETFKEMEFRYNNRHNNIFDLIIANLCSLI